MTEAQEATFRTPRGGPARMKWREGTNDWNTLISCMSQDEYGMSRTPGAATLVDIGGHIGGVGIGYAIDNRETRVWIVEPLPANCELIRDNIAMNELGDRVMLIHAAGDKPGRKRTKVLWGFTDDESGQHHRFIGNSSFGMTSKTAQSADVACVSLPNLVDMAGGHIDILKIDCEGGEYAIFRGSASGVGHIVGEFHAGYAELEALLSGTHTVTMTSGDANFGGFTADPR